MNREIKFDFVFQHPQTKDVVISTEYTLDKILDGEALEFIQEKALTCDCQPVGEYSFTECNCCEHFEEYELIAKRQWTGITDRNRVEIYHGDILKMYRHSDDTHKHEVGKVWHDGKYHEDIREVKYKLGTFYTKGSYGIEITFMHMARPGESYEVIGNIHQTPELLAPR